ncbi:MAG TPA: ribbon-helix-helix protein, CopG family [Thermoanaerobaculia bacterium]|nr:ribbon-helix-helix protein, CopG family [Thermoanaerobaculia bacterium]
MGEESCHNRRLTSDPAKRIFCRVKIKASVLLSEDLLAAVDQRARIEHQDRSAVIEAAVRAFVVLPSSPEQNARDLKILNERAERLNQEAEDVLSYQVLR